MDIRKIKSSRAIEAFIEAEQEKYEAENGVSCNYTPFCFAATIGDEIVGVVSGATFFSEIYMDELVVKEAYRRKGIGTQMIKAVEAFYHGRGFHNINCCTNGFQASAFYEKCGFELEFVREDKSDPKLNKYFYIKYLDYDDG
jgi:ribosomal protein S18 acetylase RimI-like enzyme